MPHMTWVCLTVVYSVVVRALSAQKLHLWSPPAPAHRFWSFLSPCLSRTMVMGPTDPEFDPWADGLDLTFLLQTCSKVIIPAALTQSDPDLQIDFQLDHGFASSAQTCLIVWALGRILAAVYGPALLPHWDSKDPALVTLPLAPCCLGEQLPLLLPDSNAKALILSKQYCRPEPDASLYPAVAIRWFPVLWVISGGKGEYH